MAASARIAKGAVVGFKIDVVGLAEIPKAIGAVARISPSHSRTGA